MSKLKSVEFLSSEQITEALNALKASQGWFVVCEFDEENKKRLKSIIEGIENDLIEDETLTEVKRARLQEQRKRIQEEIKENFTNIPDIIIARIEKAKEAVAEEPESEELDPYEKLDKQEVNNT